jgi:hypothetical protein
VVNQATAIDQRISKIVNPLAVFIPQPLGIRLAIGKKRTLVNGAHITIPKTNASV